MHRPRFALLLAAACVAAMADDHNARGYSRFAMRETEPPPLPLLDPIGWASRRRRAPRHPKPGSLIAKRKRRAAHLRACRPR